MSNSSDTSTPLFADSMSSDPPTPPYPEAEEQSDDVQVAPVVTTASVATSTGCYGCDRAHGVKGGHEWADCPVVKSQHVCGICSRVGHIPEVCAMYASQRKQYVRNFGDPVAKLRKRKERTLAERQAAQQRHQEEAKTRKRQREWERDRAQWEEDERNQQRDRWQHSRAVWHHERREMQAKQQQMALRAVQRTKEVMANQDAMDRLRRPR